MSIGSSLATAVERLVAPVEGIHRAIAGGWFRRLDPPARPVQVIHDGISTTVYSAIRQTANLAGKVVDATVSTDRPAIATTEAVLNGFWGDAVAEVEMHGNSMSLRDRFGHPLDMVGLATAFGTPPTRIVVLVHGLSDTERCWSGTYGAPGFLDAIDADPELTAVTVRYNTGLHVSTNGLLLADLLETLASSSSIAASSIALVGHSMGGLVARSAVLAGEGAGHSWVETVSDLVTLGTPHRGAPLEKLANLTAWGLRVAPVTVPIADFIDSRSVGIKDLRFGSVVEPDWTGHDPDSLLENTVVSGISPSSIRYHFVGGVVTSKPGHPLGRLVGDLMVRTLSSSGPPLSSGANVVTHEGIHHRQLTRDQRVIDQVMGWLTEPASW